jgi:hypothetical protein
LSEQHGGQSSRASPRQGLAVERDFLARIAQLGAEVAPVVDREPLSHDQAQPQISGQLGVPQIAVHTARHFDERILEYVGGIDPPLESGVHAKLDHTAEAVAVMLEEIDKRLAVAGPDPFRQSRRFARAARHDALHTS